MTVDDDAFEVAVRRHAAQLAAATGRHPARSVPPNPEPVAGTRDFVLSAVAPGWLLSSRSVHWDGEDDDGYGIAGVCVEIVHDAGTDTETGEMWERTRFRCVACWRPHPWCSLDAADVAGDRLYGPDRPETVAAIRWLIRPIGNRRDRTLSRKERDRLIDAWRLVVALDAL